MTRTYEITEPPPEIHRFFDLLRAGGFTVTPTPFARGDVQRKNVWRISWRFEYVGQAAPGLWNKGTPMLYRFMRWEKSRKGFPCPKPFDLQAFSRERGCTPAALRPEPESQGESYLHVRTVDAALKLLRYSASRIDDSLYASTLRDAPTALLEDLAAIESDWTLSESERRVFRDARCGQGKFRSDLDEEFGGCGATGLNERAALRASHIVPWSTASKPEKTDPQNGLLLSANVDALFDRYLLTFRPDGTLSLSSTISASDRIKLGLSRMLHASFVNPARGRYLARHNAIFDERDKAADVRRKKLEEGSE